MTPCRAARRRPTLPYAMYAAAPSWCGSGASSPVPTATPFSWRAATSELPARLTVGRPAAELAGWRRIDRQLGGDEEMTEGEGRALDCLAGVRQHVEGALAPPLAVQQVAHAEQELDGQRRPGRGRVVGAVARPRDQCFVVVRRVEEAAGAVVPEPAQHGFGQLLGMA